MNKENISITQNNNPISKLKKMWLDKEVTGWIAGIGLILLCFLFASIIVDVFMFITNIFIG